MKRKRSRLRPEVTEGGKAPTLAKIQMTLDMLVTLARLDRAHLGEPFQSERKAGCPADNSAEEWLDRQTLGSQQEGHRAEFCWLEWRSPELIIEQNPS